MLAFRLAAERGRILDPGLSGSAAFSFGSAFDAQWLGFAALRVLNRVELAPGAQLPAARRANMVLLTLVLSGSYRVTSQAGDSGTVSIGQWVCTAAGAGIDVVEENLSAQKPLRLLQAWVQPRHSNAAAAQTVAAPALGQERIAADSDAPLLWDVDGRVQRHALAPGGTLALAATPERAVWVEVVGGEAALGGRFLRRGDGLGVMDERAQVLVSSFGADVLVFDLPR